jgi:DNA-binding GntR family transcriptional regulator
VAETLKRLTLREQAETAVRDMIASYRFTPGKRINVERLAKDLGVSRTPVWQALKNLEDEGLVKHVPNRGIRMAQMTLQMAYALYEVRGLLEGLAGRLAAERIDKKAITRLKSLLKEQRRIISDQDVVEYSKSDFEFHGIIYDSCGNWLLSELLENIKVRSRPFVCDLTSILPELYQDHIDAVEAFKIRDPDGAEMVMKRHNLRVNRQIEKAQKEDTKRLS